MSDRVRLRRSELFASEVDRAIERERRLRDPRAEPPPIAPWRALVQSSMFHLPLAGLLAGLVAWMLVEPYFDDLHVVGGEVVLVNTEPFEWVSSEELGFDRRSALSLTVGAVEVVVVEGETVLEDGANGEPAFSDMSHVEPGVHLEASGEAIDGNRLLAMGLRPATPEQARRAGQEISPGREMAMALLFFPLVAALIALGLFLADGFASRNWGRMAERAFLGTFLTFLFAALGMIPAGIVISVASMAAPDDGFFTVDSIPPVALLVFAAGRSVAWACIGAALGLGMHIARSTAVQLRNAVIGGALGGALGGIFFDPIDRFLTSASMFDDASVSRLVGVTAVGLAVGLFTALVDRLAREAWVQVRTGPLAGKSFVLYRTPTVIGSSPRADIYLFKDSEIAAEHASIHRIGNRYEIENTSKKPGIDVGGRVVGRRRLTSGDQIVLGGTVLTFEERSGRESHG